MDHKKFVYSLLQPYSGWLSSLFVMSESIKMRTTAKNLIWSTISIFYIRHSQQSLLQKLEFANSLVWQGQS